MKKRNIIILILTLLIFISCNPIPTFEQIKLSEDMQNPTLNIRLVESNSIDIQFKPVFNANYYTFILTNKNNNKITKITKSTKELDKNNCFDGYFFTYKITGILSDTDYNIEVFAYKGDYHSKANIISHTLRKYKTPPSIKPFIQLKNKKETSCCFKIKNIDGISHFKITYNDKILIIPSSFEDYTILNIDGLEKDTEYQAALFLGIDENNFSNDPTFLSIPKYLILENQQPPQITSIKKEDSNSSNLLFNIISSEVLNNFDYTKVELYYCSKTDDSKKLMASTLYQKNQNNYSLIVPIFKEDVLNYKYFARISYYDENNNIKASSIYSRDYSYKDCQIKTTTNKIIISWDKIDNVEKYTIKNIDLDTIIDCSNKFDEKDNKILLTIDEDIQSKKTYKYSIIATLKNGRELTIGNSIIEASTKSYAGTYKWETFDENYADKQYRNFIVDVVDNENYNKYSIYPYYIFINEKDCAFDGTPHRIMPLIDNESYSNPIPFTYESSFAKAYSWNESKWNTMGLHPSSWENEKKEKIDNYDKYTSITKSTIDLLGISVQTKTEFSFRTVDNKQELVFVNSGDGVYKDMVNIGIAKNPNPEVGDNNLTFVLKKLEN